MIDCRRENILLLVCIVLFGVISGQKASPPYAINVRAEHKDPATYIAQTEGDTHLPSSSIRCLAAKMAAPVQIKGE